MVLGYIAYLSILHQLDCSRDLTLECINLKIFIS